MHWFIILVLVALSGCSMFNRASSEDLAIASETKVVCTKEKVVGSILRKTRCVSAGTMNVEGEQARELLRHAKEQNAVLRPR